MLDLKEAKRVASISHKTGLFGFLSRLLEHISLQFVLIFTALSTGIISALLDVIIDWLADIRSGHCTTHFLLSFKACCPQQHTCDQWLTHAQSTNYFIAFIIYTTSAILMAIIPALLVTKLAPLAFHTGIPEIKAILGGITIDGFLSPVTLLVKAIGLCFSVSSGLSLGKEGPLIHVTCCLSELWMSLLRLLRIGDWTYSELRKRQIYSAAAAAGVSVAFGAPLGGVMFALEELNMHLFPTNTLWQAFVCAALAAVTLQWFNPFGTGKLVLFSVTANQPWKQFELVFWLLLGALGGLLGVALVKLNIKIANIRKKSILKSFPIVETIVVAIVTALLSYSSIITRVQNSSLVSALFQECSTEPDMHISAVICDSKRRGLNVVLLAVAAIFKLCMTAYTFGITVPAGIFLPGLAIGACAGRSLGGLLKILEDQFPGLGVFADCHSGQGCILPGLYATVGAAATLAGITKMTVSLVVIVFELTGALSHVVPIMIAVMTAKWVGDAFGKEGIYDAWINHQKYTYLPQVDFKINGVISEDIADLETSTLDVSGDTLHDLIDLFNKDTPNLDGYSIVKGDDRLFVGWINRKDFSALLNSIEDTEYDTPFTFESNALSKEENALDFSRFVDTSQLFFYPQTPVEIVVSTFQKMGVSRVFLVTQAGSFVGIIDRVRVSELMMNKLHSNDEKQTNLLSLLSCLRPRRNRENEYYELEVS
ncbi:hypothetical protein E3Q16_00615 [Wallemia mellicola]|uniref:Chloride channel protein n=1 Tax=Wallemia mellicola TaxID=1708541 RepID=A0AB74KHV2_9BASI|nr:hypothetical protein E3Q20_00398 [Wallemia mellicola]TIC07281.1 hypothetical protein E3Q16_00615 [Wallemia mellicola]TIC25765.1 hypothetical protein E3Q12_00897 [Wallemia mellicola]TIC37549.1 hypothetical protein E3Q09_00719 [Wallemia mellicola]TIC70640.1 hypothetical protein E3Q03_00974 [Wallemia mellicola]